jgi:hypothetical protein
VNPPHTLIKSRRTRPERHRSRKFPKRHTDILHPVDRDITHKTVRDPIKLLSTLYKELPELDNCFRGAPRRYITQNLPSSPIIIKCHLIPRVSDGPLDLRLHPPDHLHYVIYLLQLARERPSKARREIIQFRATSRSVRSYTLSKNFV